MQSPKGESRAYPVVYQMTEMTGGQCPLLTSLEFESWLEAEYYKWLESERAGHDRGHGAREEWVRRYWDIFCRWRLMDHLYGRKRFKEFYDPAFGCLCNPDFARQPEVQFIIKHFLEGWENVDFFSKTWNLVPREPLYHALALFRINDGRHTPPSWLSVGKV